jgi:hypothetical protein
MVGRHVLAPFPAMEPVIDIVAVSEVDRLKPPRRPAAGPPQPGGGVAGSSGCRALARGLLACTAARTTSNVCRSRSPERSSLGTGKVCAAMRQCASSEPRDVAVRGPRAPCASTSGKAPSTSRDAGHAHHPVSARAGPATRRWRPDQAVRSSGPACAGRRRRVARPPGMTRRRRRAASVLADGTRPARPRYCRRIRRH